MWEINFVSEELFNVGRFEKDKKEKIEGGKD